METQYIRNNYMKSLGSLFGISMLILSSYLMVKNADSTGNPKLVYNAGLLALIFWIGIFFWGISLIFKHKYYMTIGPEGIFFSGLELKWSEIKSIDWVQDDNFKKIGIHLNDVEQFKSKGISDRNIEICNSNQKHFGYPIIIRNGKTNIELKELYYILKENFQSIHS